MKADLKYCLLLLLVTSACSRQANERNIIGKDHVLPPENSIPVNDDQEFYLHPNTKEGYESAGLELKNPLQKTKIKLEKGKYLYLVLCSHCHGKAGNADAPMIVKEKYPVPPKFSLRLPTINEGKMFHSITYGKNQMPGNKDDLTTEQKWMLIMYIQTLQ